MPALVLQLTRVGFLLLLCLFVWAAIRTIRADLRTASGVAVRTSPREARKADKQQARAQQRHSQQGIGAPLRPASLVVTAGSLSGTRLRIGEAPILIGRAEDSTLVLDDDYASTRHARLTREGDSVYLEDLGSTNGTYLDRQRVSQPSVVPVGVPIRIGRTVIELRP